MIRDFIAQIKTEGLSRTNRYVVQLNPPKSINVDSLQKILLLCDQVQLPGLTYSTIQNRTFGELREVPYEKIYDTCNMSFYVDTNLRVKRMFDSWVNSIQSPVSRTFNFYNQYTSDIKIEVQDINDKTKYNLTMYECYPKSIASVQLDYASKEVMKVNVVMQYKYWIAEGATQLDSKEVVPTNSIDLFRENFGQIQQAFNSFNPFGDIGSGFSLDRGLNTLFA